MTKRVLAASIKHETHAFNRLPTTLAHFKAQQFALADEIPKKYAGVRLEMGGFLDAAKQYGWELHHPVCTFATPGGVVTDEAFEFFLGHLTEGLKKAGTLDGVALALHGSMVTESHDDAEGEILKRVRALVGREVPIAVSLDLHANATEEMAAFADIITTYRTTPHTDMYEAAERAGRLLQRAMKGEIRPSVSLASRPVLSGLDRGRTIAGHGPMIDMLKMVKQAEAEEAGVLEIGVNAGYAWSDVAFTGPTVLVTGDGQNPAYKNLAERLAEHIWATRGKDTVHLLSMAEAIRIAAEKRPAGSGPLLIGDYTDNPGGGGHGDGTNLIRALIDAGIEDVVVGTMADPESAQVGLKAGIGAIVTIDLGGKIDPRFGGTAIRLTGKVAAVSDGIYLRKGKFATGTTGTMGPSFLLDMGRIRIIVATHRTQIDDREQFRIYGVEPEKANVLACKAMNHFRADFEPMSRKLIYVDSGGICSLDYRKFPWTKLRRPIWPLDLA